MLKEGLVIMAALLCSLLLPAQQFGGNPPSVKWWQINNPAARVIFPARLDSVAAKIAKIALQLNSATLPTIGNTRKKVDIVLHNQTTVSNAYVGLGPFRSEFYLTPAQNSFELGSLPWYEQLAIHEYRHVQQYNNFNVGLSKAFHLVFGEEGQALANSLVVPDWFFEGDAVFNETGVSGQGRGRLPYFFNGYRALWAAGKNYSWMKLRNGSLRDYTPDHYPLGFMLVGYGREKYGEDFWKKVTSDAASYKGLFYPLQRSIRKYSGEDYVAFRQKALQYFTSPLPVDEKFQGEQTAKHFIADEEYPAFVNDTTIVFMKSSYNRLPAFVKRSGESEKLVRVRDVSLDNYFSYRNNKIVYASYKPDTRWGWKDYSELQVLDLLSGRQTTITKRSKYFSPDISNDGSTIVAVHVSPSGGSSLQLVDAGNGMLIKSLSNPGKLFYTYPKFYRAAQVISAVRDTVGRMSLALTNLAKDTTANLLPFSFNVIGFPFIQNDTVYFTAANGRYDRLFAYVINSRRLYALQHRLLNSVTGAYAPVANRDDLLWSQFTAYGYRLRQARKLDISWQDITAQGLDSIGAGPVSGAISAVAFNVVQGAAPPVVNRYPKAFHLVNFHSLEPYISDPVYSFSLVGENVLNTLQSELFYSYNRNEQSNQLGFSANYGAWFPYTSLGANYTIDRRGLYHGRRVYWNETELQAGASIPLNLSRGRNYTSLNAGANLVYNEAGFKGVYKDSLGRQSFGYINSYLNFSNQVQKARQHIYPRLAQSVVLNYKKAVWSLEANQFLASGTLYFPGFSQNHNIVINLAFQQKDSLNQHEFSNGFPFSRGYSAESFYQMKKWGVNYHFPLFYPDAGVGNIVYLLRVRANCFYDDTYVNDFLQSGKKFTTGFRSAGTELFFDTRWWNQLPLSVGFRYSYLLDRDIFGGAGANRFEFILPVNLLQH